MKPLHHLVRCIVTSSLEMVHNGRPLHIFTVSAAQVFRRDVCSTVITSMNWVYSPNGKIINCIFERGQFRITVRTARATDARGLQTRVLLCSSRRCRYPATCQSLRYEQRARSQRGSSWSPSPDARSVVTSGRAFH